MAQISEQVVMTAVENITHKVPRIPAGMRKSLVNLIPWLALCFGISNVLLGLLAIVLTPLTTFFTDEFGWYALLNAGIILVTGIMLLYAFPKLNRREYIGWRLVFWIVVLRYIPKVLLFDIFSIIFGLIGAGMVLYLLFQIKSYYVKQ